MGNSNDFQSYTHTARPSRWVQVLTWLCCASLMICGAVTFILACVNFKRLSHVVLGFYLCIFGVVVACSEMGLSFTKRCFGFLSTSTGVALFFVFAGTLGVSFGVGTSADVLVPFISGIVWIVFGVLCLTSSIVLQTRGAPSSASVEGP